MKQTKMEIRDVFWSGQIEKMCESIIPYQYEVLSDAVPGIPKSHAIENFRIAAKLADGEYAGMLFQDSDVAKWIEGAAYSLRIKENPKLESEIDELIEIIGRAQQSDGYLNTYYTCVRKGERLTNIAHGHEMYCAGHLAEAAAAYAEATGKERLLQIVERYMDWFMERIGPEEGKLHIYPGHPELELALYRLYQYTQKETYLDFMKYLLLERGKQPSFLLNDSGFGEQFKDKWFGLEYHQAQKPVQEQREAVGHAVRAMYLYSGLADLAYETGDEKTIRALDALWQDVTKRKMYITGAVGADEHGEAFSVPYDLPNDRAYAETCASIGLVFWARRMLRLKLDSQYSDIMELALYNGVLSGMSDNGKEYFYVSPLMLNPREADQRYDLRHVKTSRVTWFGCACCPPNAARTITSLDKYVYDYYQEENQLAIHLYIGGKIYLEEGGLWEITGDYLGVGRLEIKYSGQQKEMSVRLRKPGWSKSIGVLVNGEEIQPEEVTGYMGINKAWCDGDVIQLQFDIQSRFVYANPKVSADSGRAAILRGPIVYCLEEADNGEDLNALIAESICGTQEMGQEREGREEIYPPVYIRGYREYQNPGNHELYSFEQPERKKVTMKAVPYARWGNRGIGEMLVWVRR